MPREIASVVRGKYRNTVLNADELPQKVFAVRSMSLVIHKSNTDRVPKWIEGQQVETSESVSRSCP
jgi:hypothetical protein